MGFEQNPHFHSPIAIIQSLIPIILRFENHSEDKKDDPPPIFLPALDGAGET